MSFRTNFKYHHPVLLKESVGNLLTDKNGVYIDATFGLGGHSHAILKKLDKKGTLIAIDQDKESIRNNLIKDQRLKLFHSNFICIEKILNKKNIKKVSGILIDLGISSFQIENPNRGFSHQLKNCVLDMRFNQESPYSAQQVINNSSKKKLLTIFREYGNFTNSKKIVEKILRNRVKKKIITTLDLINLFIIKGSFKKRKNFFSRLFQSIRIEVNQEIDMLKKILLKSSNFLLPKGRMAIISYHSIEDRMIKNFFKKGILLDKKFDIFPFSMIHKKVIRPTIQEKIKNPRSKSAKLRIAEKIN